MARKWEARAVGLLGIIEGKDALNLEEVVPHGDRSIDVVMELDEPSQAWGVLRDDLRGRKVVFEHYSQTPSRQHMLNGLAKLYWAAERQCLDEDGDPRERHAPLLLIFSVGHPRKMLRHFPGIQENIGLRGLHRGIGLGGLEVVLVDVRNLEPCTGTRVLRLFNHHPEEFEQNMLALLADPHLDEIIRKQLEEEAMSEDSVFSRREARATVEYIKQESRRQALEEARRELERVKEEGRRQAREEVERVKEESRRQAREEVERVKEESRRQALEEARRELERVKEEGRRQAREEVERVKEESRRQAREEVEQAKDEGRREGLLRIARAQLEPLDVAQLEALEDVSALEEAVLRALLGT